MHVRPIHPQPVPAGASTVLIDEATLCALVADASASTTITYYVGHLAHDRLPVTQALEPLACRALSAVANRALRLAEAGWAHLVQRRLGPDCWAYLLVVRSRSGNRRRSSRPLRPTLPALQLG